MERSRASHDVIPSFFFCQIEIVHDEYREHEGVVKRDIPREESQHVA